MKMGSFVCVCFLHERGDMQIIQNISSHNNNNKKKNLHDLIFIRESTLNGYF